MSSGNDLFEITPAFSAGVAAGERAFAAAPSAFPELLERVLSSLHPPASRPFSVAEGVKLEGALRLSAEDCEALISAASHAFRRAAASGANAAAVGERFLAAGGSEELASSFRDAWKAGSAALLAALRTQDWGAADQLLGCAWRVAVPIASDAAAAPAPPVAVLELQLGKGGAVAGRRVAFEVSTEQLGALFDDVERIQAQLDALG